MLDIRVLLHLLAPFLLQMSFERTNFSVGRHAMQASPLPQEMLLLQVKHLIGPLGSMGARSAACAVSREAIEILQSGYRGYLDLNTLFLIIGLVDSI